MTVVVVGAGPVGVTAALLLARRGVDVLVVDRHAAAYPQPRAVHLDDESLRVLQDAGVADAFAEVSRPMAGLRLLDGDGRVLVEFRRGPGAHGWPQASMFTQPDLEALLRSLRFQTGPRRTALYLHVPLPDRGVAQSISAPNGGGLTPAWPSAPQGCPRWPGGTARPRPRR